MKNIIRVGAVIQIVLAAAFTYYAGKIDPGVEKLSRDFAQSCEEIADLCNKAKTTYMDSAANILKFKTHLKEYGSKTMQFSEKMAGYAEWLKTPPQGKFKEILWPTKRAAQLGNLSGEISVLMHDVSLSLAKQSDILSDYEKYSKPQTEKILADAAVKFTDAKSRLENIEQNTRNLKLIAYLAGVIFLLNGIAFLLIVQTLPAAAPKSAEC